MALKRNERYPGRFSNPTPDHPQGAFKNRSAPGAQDGSYLEQQWANDWDGFFGRLLTLAGITPDGNADTAQSSQYFNALRKLTLQRDNPFGDIVDDGTVPIALVNLGLKDFANKAATTKQTFADALACKYSVEVNDDQGTTRAGLYTSNGQSKITGYSNKAIIIPDKAGTMALAGESVSALRLSAPREVFVATADAWMNFATSEMVVGIYITPSPGGGAWVLNKVKVATLQALINGAWLNVTQ